MSEEKDFTIENYLQYLREKKFMGSKCKDCGEIYVPVRKICTKCNSVNMEWVTMSGKGKLAAFTSITVGTPFFVAKGYDRNNPYCFSVIHLDEGPMVSAQLVGVEESKPEQIEIGTPLEVTFLETEIKGDTRVDLGFKPA
ncbi:MAG: hypothetical protein BAJALOKI1v1_10012 [Promethearchaeota archaeon]|nr:MAG: hypothetical protein BAJALOKI1v1_10012 [Candidatus Lokiarchaeota archaeon]